MIGITANPNGAIPIGYAGENETRQAVFTYPAQWVEEFPNGSVELHVKRAGDGALYIATDTADDREQRRFTWTITATDAAYSGRGEVQLCYIQDGKIVKSQRYITNVEISTAVGDIPEPPPQTVVQEAVDAYLEQHVDVITVSDHGTDGQVLQSDGDGSYSWLTVTDPIIDSDAGVTLVPTRTLNRLARIIRQKTGYEGDMTVETMAEVMEQTDMWTTDEFALGIAPAGEEITLTMGTVPQYALYQRQNIAKVNLPYAGKINNYAFANSAISQINAPNLAWLSAYAFSGNTALVEADFPKLTTIDGGTSFSNCTGMTTVNFPKLKYIATGTFSTCYNLTSLNLPELVNVTGLITTSDGVFQNCRALETIELPKFEGTIRSTWYSGCWLLRDISLPKLAAITGTNNFQNCYALERLYAPSCMTWANNNFAGCSSLKRLCLYVKPTTLGTTALNGPALEDIYVPWSQGEVAGAPWGAPAGCTVHYNTTYDEDGEPIT